MRATRSSPSAPWEPSTPCGFRRSPGESRSSSPRDKRIRSRPEELRRLREAGLRVFWIAGKKDLSTWDWLVRVVRHWERMEHLLRERGAGPWFYALNEADVRELVV